MQIVSTEVSTMSQIEHYATSAEFSDLRRPVLKEITVPESIKRRLPSKHYVFKMVVKWSNGSTSVVYRRYSMFFDFLVKLQELVSSLCQKNPRFAENPPQLPELPGKILFGRTQIHQVAEKRRGKIEEFCQYLVSLPPEISESNLVLSFFNTWPDDTLPRPEITPPISAMGRPTSPPISPPPTNSPQSPNTPSIPTSPSSSSALDAIISHPDEMEHLEQYRVLGNYQRKDSHQVNLTFGQVVYVIEKHDTGWWMVMSDDEQGYAPASYLEAMEESSRGETHPEGVTNEVYEAMESYSPQSDDEVGFKVGDKIEVLSKSMDGWWRIRCNGHVGYSPSALIRRRTLRSNSSRGDDFIYESEKSIYEGLNIHRPPPRRNTIVHHKHYDVPRSVNPVSVELAEDTYVDPAECYSNEESKYYQVPTPIKVMSNDEKEMGSKVNGHGQPAKLSESSRNVSAGSLGGKKSPPHLPSQFQQHWTHSQSSVPRQSSSQQPMSPSHSAPQTLVYPTPAQPQSEPIYELEPEPVYENTGEISGSPPVYENAQVSLERFQVLQRSPPPISAAPSNLNDYEDMDAVHSTPSPLPPPPLPTAAINRDDYVDVDAHNTYINPHELQRTSDSTSEIPTALSPPPLPTAAINRDDYVDVDAHNTYINPHELRRTSDSASETPTAVSQPSGPAIKPPPLPTTDPPKHKPRPKIQSSKSLTFESVGLSAVDEEYIDMDPIYVLPPEEDQEEQPSILPMSPPLKSPPSQTTTPLRSKSPRPLPPPPYSKLKETKMGLISTSSLGTKKFQLQRTQSLEDLLSSSAQEHNIPRQHSPPFERRNQQFTSESLQPVKVPLLPLTSQIKERFEGGGSMDKGSTRTTSVPKPPPARFIAGRPRKVTPDKPVNFNTDTELQGVERMKPPLHLPPRGTSTHRPLMHTVSESGIQDEVDAPFLKTYVALSSYTSQAAGCISFSTGDKCVLVQKTKDGWWLVNIGGREGWTPAEYWQEEIRARLPTVANPPSIAPQPLRKPRSHTVATDAFSSSEFTSSIERSCDSLASASLTSSLSGSSEAERSQFLASLETVKPSPPLPPLKPAKPKGPPPPKPKPFPGVGSPLKRKPPGERPPVPQRPPPKPSSRPSTSPPGHRRGSDEKTPSPPPLPAWRKVGNLQVNGVFESSEERDVQSGTYVLLANAREQTPIESARWFVGKMERGQAEQFLMEHGRQREFLIRERAAKNGYYALSIRYHYSCKHFNIDPKDGQFCMGALTFPTIEDIIRHYQQNSLFIHDSQHVTLGQPVKRRTRHSIEKNRANVC